MYSSIILLIVLAIFATTALGAISLAPWVPSRKRDLARIFKLAGLKPNEVFYDLGCGTGQIVMYANKNFGAKAIGIEIGLPMYLVCRLKKLLRGNKNIIFKWKNFFKENLEAADVIYLFGRPGTLNQKLKEKITNEVKPGTRIISYVFPMENWQPTQVDGDGIKQAKVYLYAV